ncbi:MAG: hypothetical protein A3H76_01510 [Candidatus Lloydbacteria bacterium RIFCSPLOWO2_02_FULL_54_12]|nr:MAG: hypothetical protein A3H76_01510 [Candidatus Lloydbacteria bacterium RIFCSPLOWO2_02_FULL_54_12]
MTRPDGKSLGAREASANQPMESVTKMMTADPTKHFRQKRRLGGAASIGSMGFSPSFMFASYYKNTEMLFKKYKVGP